MNKSQIFCRLFDREKFILRAALIYAQSNLSDLNEAFENLDDELSSNSLDVNGDEGPVIAESEVEQLLFALQ